MKAKCSIALAVIYIALATLGIVQAKSEEQNDMFYSMKDPMEDREQKVKNLVEEAIEFYKKKGKEEAFAEFRDVKGKFCHATGKHHSGLLVMTQDGIYVSHCKYPGNVGENAHNWTTPDGRHPFAEIQKAVSKDPNGLLIQGFVSSLNPFNKKITSVNVYAKPYDDLVFIAPIYENEVMKGMNHVEDIDKALSHNK